MINPKNKTIVALATPTGRGGVAVIRVSGPQAFSLLEKLTHKKPTPRKAQLTKFYDANNDVIDIGLVLAFPGPNSFTGEDVIEFHGHGGPLVSDLLIKTLLHHGAHLAEPGEFSKRAFLNDKIDLTQAEAIADLIESQTTQAAKSAIRSLQGEFSKTINAFLEALIQTRVYVEAAIDFPEEEIDFLSDGKIKKAVEDLLKQLKTISDKAKQGQLLREGIKLVIAGKPNAGKSTLLNTLAGYDAAIVTDIPGTTRDVMREHIQLDGIPIHLLDTAGLRETNDQVEQLGIDRAWSEIKDADAILLITEAKDKDTQHAQEKIKIKNNAPLLTVINKIDLSNEPARQEKQNTQTNIYVSAKTGEGIDLLKENIKNLAGADTKTQGHFIARRRHLDALARTKHAIETGLTQLNTAKAGELLAEELRVAQNALGEITGTFTADDLLGEIFGSFCIGK